MAQRNCIDCGKGLGYGVKACTDCGSTDPYGSKREAEKFGFIIAGIAAVIFGISWFLFQVNPIQLIMKIPQILK